MKKIPPSYYLIFLSLGFFGGIFVAELVRYDWRFLLIAGLALLFLILLFWKDEKIRLLAGVGILFLAGIFYYHIFDEFRKDELKNFYQKEVALQGQIVTEPDIRSDKVKYTIQVYNIQEKETKESQKTTGKVLVTHERYPEYQFADWLKISGKIQEPQKYPDFDYKNYLSRFGIHSILTNSKVAKIEKPSEINQNIFLKSWLSFKKFLFNIKKDFSEKINQILPEPQSSFLAGLLLGAKRTMPQDLMDAFNRTGTTHIVVISGYNITIIIKAFMVLTRRWSKKLAIMLAILGIFLFTIMVGGEAPVMRAALMALFIVWAERIGRKSDIGIALILTALIMILINPKILRFDLGFQLSFLAVAGLIWFVPILENLISRLKYLKSLPALISEPLMATLAAQLFAVPIILYNFHRLSLIAPLANVLVLPLIPLTMFLGFLAVILTFIWLGLGQLIAFVTWLFLSYMIWVVFWLSRLPMASFEISQISWIWLSAWYLSLLIFIWWYYKKFLTPKESPSGKEKVV